MRFLFFSTECIYFWGVGCVIAFVCACCSRSARAKARRPEGSRLVFRPLHPWTAAPVPLGLRPLPRRQGSHGSRAAARHQPVRARRLHGPPDLLEKQLRRVPKYIKIFYYITLQASTTQIDHEFIKLATKQCSYIKIVIFNPFINALLYFITYCIIYSRLQFHFINDMIMRNMQIYFVK